MAQASSVPAREPSMEEILASIRRIIEDSDTGHKPDDQNPPVAEAFEASEQPEVEVEAFRSELSAMEQEAELHQEPQYSAPEFTPEPPAEAAPVEQPQAVRYQPPAAAQRAEPEYEPPVAQAEPATTHAAEQYEAPAEQSSQRNSILSESAERQVTAAFSELSDVFASTQRRSFDDVAEDLMRPMLQDWLDNNLPILVERLVREEIERVARGGSR